MLHRIHQQEIDQPHHRLPVYSISPPGVCDSVVNLAGLDFTQNAINHKSS